MVNAGSAPKTITTIAVIGLAISTIVISKVENAQLYSEIRQQNQSTSGIAGYTLIYNSRHYRIVSHQPFTSKWNAVHKNDDIRNDSEIFEKMETRMRVSQTDEGAELQDRVDMLMMLLDRNS